MRLSDFGYFLLLLILLGVYGYPVCVWVMTRTSPKYAAERQLKVKLQSDRQSYERGRGQLASATHLQTQLGIRSGPLVDLRLDREKDEEYERYSSIHQPEREQYPRYVVDGMREHPEAPELRRYLG